MMNFFVMTFCCSFLTNINGQNTRIPNYTCQKNEVDATFTFSSGSHSGWNFSMSCSLPQCHFNSSDINSCRWSSIPCFEYQTTTNMSICFPGIDCPFLEVCHNITHQCSSNTSICVMNSCCSTRAVCVPLSYASFCSSDGRDSKNYFANMFWQQTCPGVENQTDWGYLERFIVYSGTNNANGCGDVATRAVLFFHEIDGIPSVVPTVQSAKLYLYGVIDDASDPQNWMNFDWRSPNDLWVERCTSPWRRNTTSWFTQPNTTSINAATIPGTHSPSIYNPVIDVTDLVNDMRSPGQSNYGFMLRCQTETPYRSMTFYAFGHPNIDLRPKLELTY